MRSEVRPEVRPEVRTQELMASPGRLPSQSPGGLPKAAGARLLDTYAGLARRGEHLFAGVLAGGMPQQWHHYPEDDAVDHGSGFQWFYHAHSPEDRPDTIEHGHVHLFARRKLWSRRVRSARENAFLKLSDDPPAPATTRHLLAIGFDAKGIPINLFTVNSWVTGDLMLSAPTTMAILDRIALDTGHEAVDAVIECVVRLCRDDIREVLEARDRVLSAHRGAGLFRDERFEVLSDVGINLDAKLTRL